MSTPSFKLPKAGQDLPRETQEAIELAVQSVIDAFYEEIGGIVTGLLPVGEFDASSGRFPSSALHGTYYFVSIPGKIDGESFCIGDWLIPLVDDASATIFAGNWARGNYSKVVSRVYENTSGILASLEASRGEGALWQTQNGFRYIEKPDDAPSADYNLTTAAPLKIKLSYQPDQEVNVLALRSFEDGDDMAKTMRRAAASFPGNILRVPPGSYSIGSTLEFGDLDATIIRSDGAKFFVEEDVVFGRAAPPVFEEIQSIAAIPALEYWGARRTVECTNGAVYRAGDLLTLVADNKMESTRRGNGGRDYRMGFSARIEAIVGNIITLDRPLPADWSFRENPRIGRMPRRRLDWKGGVIGYEKGHDADWHGYAMLIHGMSDVDIQVEIEHTYNAAIRLLGCFEPRIVAVGRDLLNDQGNRNFGYLVSDSSQGANVKVLAGRNRHAYTTDQPLVAANSSELHLYGATSFGHITGQSHGNSQAGFDTHHGSAYMNFHDLFVSGGVDGGGQIVLRGVGHRVVNCVGINGKNGIYIFTEDGVSQSTQGISIVNPHIDVDDKALRIDGAFAEVHGGTFRSRKYGKSMRISNGRLTFKSHVTLRPGGPADVNNGRMIELVNGEIDARGAELRVDLSNIPSGADNYDLVELGGDVASRLMGGTWRVFNDTGMRSFLNKAGRGAHDAGGGIQLITDKCGASPEAFMEVTGASYSVFTGAWTWKHAGGDGNSGYISHHLTTDGFELPLHHRDDAKVFVKLYASGSDRVLGALPAIAPAGQTLMIVNADPTHVITIPHGVFYNTSLPSAMDILLSYGQACAVTFDGRLWWRSS